MTTQTYKALDSHIGLFQSFVQRIKADSAEREYHRQSQIVLTQIETEHLNALESLINLCVTIQDGLWIDL